jgi:DNA-binding NarL/FixJ family response regulator
MTAWSNESGPPPSGTAVRRSLRILIADDHEIVRRGVRGLIEDRGWTVVGEAADGREAIAETKRLSPDIVVLDIAMPLLNGLDATREIHKASPGSAVLVLTMYESEQMVRSVLAAGAKGYVLKSDAAQHLVAAIEALASDKPFFSGRASQILLDSYLTDSSSPGEPKTPDTLTPREREVLQLLAEGKSNKQVATFLDLAVKTVETHRSNIMRKLNLHNLSELIHYAVRNHLIDV